MAGYDTQEEAQHRAEATQTLKSLVADLEHQLRFETEAPDFDWQYFVDTARHAKRSHEKLQKHRH